MTPLLPPGEGGPIGPDEGVGGKSLCGACLAEKALTERHNPSERTGVPLDALRRHLRTKGEALPWRRALHDGLCVDPGERAVIVRALRLDA
jgi:hypothetical protein